MEIDVTGTLDRAARATWRSVAVSAIGPLTILAGTVWAIAQPYRLTFLDAQPDGIWDHLVQPPLLVIAVGLAFYLAVARPLLRALEGRP